MIALEFWAYFYAARATTFNAVYGLSKGNRSSSRAHISFFFHNSTPRPQVVEHTSASFFITLLRDPMHEACPALAMGQPSGGGGVDMVVVLS
jgi:hypothetical protein